MALYDYDIGVIAGGAAGLTVSSGAAQLGAKTLIKSAHVYHTMQRSRDFGLPVVNLPPVDFSQIEARIKSVIDVSNAIFHLPRKADYTWMPWATYCDPELAIIGMNEKRQKLLKLTIRCGPNILAKMTGLWPKARLAILLTNTSHLTISFFLL